MVKNYKWLGVITLCILLNSPLCAQVLKWDGMPSNAENSNGRSSETNSIPASVFPKYIKTDNPTQDEERFQTMLLQWNAQNPGKTLQAQHIKDLKSGETSEREILQELAKAEELNRLNPQYRESMSAKQRLIDAGLGHVWGASGMPDYPKGATEPSDYTEWLYAVRAWASSDAYLQQRTHIEGSAHQTQQVDASGELVKPVFIDTGNPEYDAEVYHQKKLRYSEALNSRKSAEKE
jgi:hypothetical protein